jgi:hypothetical protein
MPMEESESNNVKHYNLFGDDVILDIPNKKMIINGKEFTFEKMDEFVKMAKGANRMHKPMSLLLYTDYKNGKLKDWDVKLVESEGLIYLDESDEVTKAEGYDCFGSKEMEPFEGKAIIQYYGGPGNLQYLKKAGNGRFVWIDSSVPEEPYVFNSFEDALKVQEQVGGEIVSYEHTYLGN